MHSAYFAAGAEVATTASYQASIDGFRRRGLDPAAMLRRSVTLGREARDAHGRGWVAASVGPYGAVLADGSEYRGDYRLSVAQLRRFHRPRMEILAAAGADLLAIETIPCLAEVEAVLAEVDRLAVPAWLSLTCHRMRTREGEDVSGGIRHGRRLFTDDRRRRELHRTARGHGPGRGRCGMQRQTGRRLSEQWRGVGPCAACLDRTASFLATSGQGLDRLRRPARRWLLPGGPGRDRAGRLPGGRAGGRLTFTARLHPHAGRRRIETPGGHRYDSGAGPRRLWWRQPARAQCVDSKSFDVRLNGCLSHAPFHAPIGRSATRSRRCGRAGEPCLRRADRRYERAVHQLPGHVRCALHAVIRGGASQPAELPSAVLRLDAGHYRRLLPAHVPDPESRPRAARRRSHVRRLFGGSAGCRLPDSPAAAATPMPASTTRG